MLALIQKELRLRIITENIPRIQKCITLLSEAQLINRIQPNLNSVANLVMHLNGNVRQWFFSGILEQPDVRNRPGEFSNRSDTKAELQAILDALSKDIEKQLHHIPAKKLAENMVIQGIETTGFGAIVHVIEHFSYHTGQIAYITKYVTKKDLGFYKNFPKIADT